MTLEKNYFYQKSKRGRERLPSFFAKSMRSLLMSGIENENNSRLKFGETFAQAKSMFALFAFMLMFTFGNAQVNDCSNIDYDNDGISAIYDCDDTDPNLPRNPGASCNDGNPNTTNDRIQADGCTCAGEGSNICYESRSASPITHCENGVYHSIYLGHNGRPRRYTMSNGVFEEFSNGTAKITGYVSGVGQVNIRLGSRSTTSGSPANPCGRNTSDWYYYMSMSGNVGPYSIYPLNGSHVFQVGTGAGYDSNSSRYGGAGWYHYVYNGVQTNGEIFLRFNENDCCKNPPEVYVGTEKVSINGQSVNLSASLSGGARSVSWRTSGSGSFSNSSSVNTIYIPSQADIANGKVTLKARTNSVTDCGYAEDELVLYLCADPCVDNGGDADNDGVCANQDCDDNDASVGERQAPGTACNDGDPSTETDVIQSDGCTCAGTPINPCLNSNLTVDLGNDQTLCNGPVTLNASVSGAANCSTTNCENKNIVRWDFETCNAQGDAGSYTEFQPSYPNGGACQSISATNVYREQGNHSCAPGFGGGIAMCIGTQQSCSAGDYSEDYALKFETTLSPGTTGSITGLRFYEKAPTRQVTIAGGDEGCNNYPTKYLLRVYKGNQLIYSQNDISTSRNWNEEIFDFSNNSLFEVTNTTTFRFELRPYCRVGNGCSRSVWDVDNVRLYGGCCTTVTNNDLTYNWSTGAASSSINVTSQGNYALTVTDCNGCTATDQVYVERCAPCYNNGGDADNDGVCANQDCDDNDASVGEKQTPGTACDDGDTYTHTDVIQNDGCSCEGTPVSCLVDINITNKVCSDNGTPSDPTDDTYTFDLTVFRTGGGTDAFTGSYSNPYLGVNQITGAYNTPVKLGPFPAGTFTSSNTIPPVTVTEGLDITVSVNDIDNPYCTGDNVTVTSPGPCSDSTPNECNAQITVDGSEITITNITGAIKAVKVLRQDFSTVFSCDDWTTPCNGTETVTVPGAGTYFVQVQTYADWSTPICNIFETVVIGGTPPPPVCSITATVSNIICNSEGTSKPGDDTYSFDVTADIVNGGGWGYDIVGTGITMQPSGTTVTVSGLLIRNGAVTFTVKDHDVNNCTTTITVTPPAPCSDNDPCLGSGGDADNDGVCANDDCDDNNPNISNPGDSCDDGNSNTENDVIQSDCTCAGTPVSTNCKATVTVTGNGIQVTGLTDPITSVNIIDQTWTTVASCNDWTNPCSPTELFTGLTPGTYFVQVKTYLDWNTPICDIFETVTVTGGDPCANAGGDADNDGVCANVDCDDNDASIGGPGSACDDGDANTINDVLDANCNCAGTPNNNTCDVDVTVNGSKITVSNINAPISAVKFLSSNWAVLQSCDDWTTPCESMEMFTAPSPGTYYVQVQTYQDWSTPICDIFETVTITGGNPCQYSGGDADNDGICANQDCDDNDASIGAQGSSCDDGDPNTINDTVGQDCICRGTIVYECPNLQANIGDSCDDGNSNTNNDTVQPDCTCAGTTICDNVTDGGTITGDETQCGAYDPAPITNVTLPSGGSGAIEYIWLSSTTGCPTQLSQQIPGATGMNYDPGTITQTTYYRRCARRAGCTEDSDWLLGESNCVVKTVDDGYNANVTGLDYIGSFGGLKYYIKPDGDLTYTQTLALANARGGKLPVITSAAQNQFLDANTNGRVWLGLNDAAAEGTFVWYDGTPVSYENWQSGEPNDYGTGEDYVHMLNGGTWNDNNINSQAWAVITFPECGSIPTVCADRNATNATECSNGTSYGVFVEGNYYEISGGKFVEYTDGTAKLTGQAVGLGSIDIDFTRRSNSGNPVFNNCLGSVPTTGWYYYDNFSGTIGGWSLVGNNNHQFQIGQGANNQNGNQFGGSGWMYLDGKPGDINLLLDGSPTACATYTQRTQILGLDVAVEKGEVALSWSNNTGDLNQDFEIQRSVDGVNFETISIEDTYMSDAMKFYKSRDGHPFDGANFYRVKLNYLDGTSELSETRRVNIADVEDFGLFPNPARETINVSLKGYTGSDIQIQLIDQFGKRIKEIDLNNVSDSYYPIELNGVQNGVYSVWIFAEGKKPVGKKMIVNKMY